MTDRTFPYSMMDSAAEMAPIDCTAKAILTLAATPEACCVFHPYNNHSIYMGDIIYAMKEYGMDIELSEDEDYERALELFADIVFHSVFPAKEIEKEKEVVIDEINSYKDSPGELIYDDFEELIYDGYAIGRNILGNEAAVKGLTREDLLRFVRRNYHPGRMVVSSVGDIPFDRLVRLVERYFGEVEGKEEPLVRVKPEVYVPRRKVVERETYQNHCVLGSVAYDYMQDKRLALSLLVNILGGTGMNSRLYLNIRERYGLAYNIEAAYTPYSDTGIFTVYFGCDAEDLERCLQLCRREMETLCRQPLGRMQLLKAKRQMTGQMMIAAENYENMMLSIGKSFLVYGKVDETKTVCAEVEGVTPELLQEVAQEIFAEERQSVLIYK